MPKSYSTLHILGDLVSFRRLGNRPWGALVFLLLAAPALNGQVSFHQPAGSPFAAGTTPTAVAVGDFNGDSKPDLVFANANLNSANVTVLLNSGGGIFAPAPGSPFNAGHNPSAVVVADFNNDGKLDIAVTNVQDSSVTILLGNGSGGFTAAGGGAIAVGLTPNAIAAGDFNNDGKMDLAVPDQAHANVVILLGNGDGTFAPAAGSPVACGNGPRAVAVGDFNGDGNLDLAVTNYLDATVTVLLGSGGGAFSQPSGSPFTTGRGPDAVVIGDFNGDLKPDMAIASLTDSNVTVYLGTGLGGFTAAPGSPYTSGISNPTWLAPGDFNQDGIIDLVVTNLGNATINILQGASNGSFSPASGGSIAMTGTPQAAAVGDFNRDHQPDIAVANYGANATTILLNSRPPAINVGFFQNGTWALDADGNGQWDGAPPDKYFTFSAGAGDIAVVGDWNGDGRAKAGVYHNGFWLLDYNGNGVWDGQSVDRFAAFGGNAGEIPIVGDWNGDGRTKVGVYYHGFWLLDYNGNGRWDGTTQDRFIAFGGNNGEVPVIGDWNGDGRTKVGYFFNGTWALDYNGNGQWDGTGPGGDKLYSFSSGQGNDIPVVGDWSASGTTKIGIYHQGFWLLDVNGNGQWDQGTDTFAALGGNGYAPVVGDWNGDGRTKIGFYYQGFWALDYNGNGQWDGPGGGDRFVALGASGVQPVVGKW